MARPRKWSEQLEEATDAQALGWGSGASEEPNIGYRV